MLIPSIVSNLESGFPLNLTEVVRDLTENITANVTAATIAKLIAYSLQTPHYLFLTIHT